MTFAQVLQWSSGARVGCTQGAVVRGDDDDDDDDDVGDEFGENRHVSHDASSSN